MRTSLMFLAMLVGCSSKAREAAPPADTAFAALQERGKGAMGVDQYTSSHIFESLPDGGRIVLQRDSAADIAGTATIRAHMIDIASRFAAGDFTIPGAVHAREVPGTKVMAERALQIRYSADTMSRGGQVRITTSDSAALSAIHKFLEFQRMDHRAAGHAH